MIYFLRFLDFQIFNESIEAANFPNELKYADITPVYEKINRHEKENYRPVSIISVIFKIVERCLYEQIYKNIEYTSSRHQMGYWKGFIDCDVWKMEGKSR